MPDVFLCVHGHFYQPPRQNPFTGVVDYEPAAAPYHDFNEKIWDECYRPNAEKGNFRHMSFDVGPTLATWLQASHPATLQLITASAQACRSLSGHGNALAHPYFHTILPLATAGEKRLLVAWGVRDFRRRYGYMPEGMWLPETAADDETLAELTAQGLGFTVLAPWQAASPAAADAGSGADPSGPYRVALFEGAPRRREAGTRLGALSVFFYNSPLSGAVSFDDDATADAARFATQNLSAQVKQAGSGQDRPQLVLIATDGEVYGHHKPFRDLFLEQLLTVEAPAAGFGLTSLAGYLAQFPPTATMGIRQGTSWSCAHGLARWDEGCDCTPGDSSWKRPLRRALRALATRLDDIFEAEASPLLRRPWHALEDYLDLRDAAVAPAAFWAAHALHRLRTADEMRLRGLLEMQFARQAMFLSCAWFFEDVDRIEPRIVLAQAHRAITLAQQHSGADLRPAFVADLQASLSLRTGRSAADIYDDVVSSQLSVVR